MASRTNFTAEVHGEAQADGAAAGGVGGAVQVGTLGIVSATGAVGGERQRPRLAGRFRLREQWPAAQPLRAHALRLGVVRAARRKYLAGAPAQPDLRRRRPQPGPLRQPAVRLRAPGELGGAGCADLRSRLFAGARTPRHAQPVRQLLGLGRLDHRRIPHLDHAVRRARRSEHVAAAGLGRRRDPGRILGRGHGAAESPGGPGDRLRRVVLERTRLPARLRLPGPRGPRDRGLCERERPGRPARRRHRRRRHHGPGRHALAPPRPELRDGQGRGLCGHAGLREQPARGPHGQPGPRAARQPAALPVERSQHRPDANCRWTRRSPRRP